MAAGTEATTGVRARLGRAPGGEIPSSPLIGILDAIHRELTGETRGDVATYIPELARADPNRFGIAIATVDGEIFEVGDSSLPFTIQSISKPLVFGMALADRGDDAVLAHVGVEPSGNPFNSVTVDPETSRPFNPMVNSGAIVTTALIDGADPTERLERIRETFGHFAGRELEIDENVLESERETGDRNRALAWLMRSFGMLEGDAQEIVDLYFGQCSVLVTCRDLAVIGATLANDGVNPLTGVRAISAHHVTSMLSIMTTCGMYDNAGEWVFNVGLPAKSGVAGGVLAVLPGQLGIGVFSPPLDKRGNSVRGIGTCERLSRHLSLHLLSGASGVRSVVRRIVRGQEITSNRVRSAAEEDTLSELRPSVALYELQGDLVFATAEKAHRTIVADLDAVSFVVLDFKYVTAIDEPALAVLNALAETLADSGRTVVAASTHPDVGIDAKLDPSVLSFVDHDAAIEWCEDRLLSTAARSGSVEAATRLEAFDLLDGLAEAELAAVKRVVETRHLAAGTVIFREGDGADAMFFLLEGRVNVLLPLNAGGDRSRRLATFGQGVAFGEMALLDEGRRSADVICDEPCTVAVLTLTALERVADDHPTVPPAIQSNLARLLARRLRAANAQSGLSRINRAFADARSRVSSSKYHHGDPKVAPTSTSRPGGELTVARHASTVPSLLGVGVVNMRRTCRRIGLSNLRAIALLLVAGTSCGFAGALASAAPAGAVSASVAVQGVPQWTDTGLSVIAGESVSITASGIIDIGNNSVANAGLESPDGAACAVSGFPLPSAPCWSMIGEIGSDVFFVGSNSSFTALESGELYLGPNDNFLTDNTGSWAAHVTAGSTLTITAGIDPSAVQAPSPDAGAPVSFTVPTASDLRGPVPVVCDHASGSTFPIGSTVVTCSATNADDTPSTVQTSLTVAVVKPPTAPNTPLIGHTVAGPDLGFGTVSFTPPAYDEFNPVTGYTATCVSSTGGVTRSATGTFSPVTVKNLTATATYTCTVTATNNVGTSGPSNPSNSFTPSSVDFCTNSTTCHAQIVTPPSATSPTQTAAVTGVPTDAIGSVALSVGRDVLTCPNTTAAPAPITTLDDSGFAPSTTLAVTLTLHWTTATSPEQVCFNSTHPFLNQASPSVPAPGPALLLSCSQTANVAPCLVSSQQVGLNIVVQFLVPGGDPKFSLVVPRGRQVWLTKFPPGKVGTRYIAQLQSSGGKAPVRWAIVSGKLPAGLTLSPSTGAITGTPKAKGNFTVVVKATDSESPPKVAQMSVPITVT